MKTPGVAKNYSVSVDQAWLWQSLLFFRDAYSGKAIATLGSHAELATEYIGAFARTALNATKRGSVPDSYDLVISFDEMPEVATAILFRPEHISRKDFLSKAKALYGDGCIGYERAGRHPFGLRLSDSNTDVVTVGLEKVSWPSVGMAMPVQADAKQAIEAITAFQSFYPGDLHVAVTANGCSSEDLSELKAFSSSNKLVHVIESTTNIGYGPGANLGLEFLQNNVSPDLYGVTNDDVMPAIDCMVEMVSAMMELHTRGHKPGVIGPVSNNIHGVQQVNIGDYRDYHDLQRKAFSWLQQRQGAVDPVPQIRGLCILIHPDCIAAVGGFDPRFGLGNFEDDDYNLRTKHAGFTTWLAEGAFLHHKGSSTFKRLGIDYSSNIQRNLQLILEKWGQPSIEALWESKAKPPMPLYQPFETKWVDSGVNVQINGDYVDLIHQATPQEFGLYVATRLMGRPRTERLKILQVLEKLCA